MRYLKFVVGASLALSGCATSQERFYEDPSAQDTTSLCRTVAESYDQKFRYDVATELVSRGVTVEDCRKKIATQDAVLTGLAVVGAAVAIGVAANNGGFGDGGYSAPSYDVAWDRINGPYGPMWRCRDGSNGQFVPDYRCAYKARVDSAWPGLG